MKLDGEPARQEVPADRQLLCGLAGWQCNPAGFIGLPRNCWQHGLPGPGTDAPMTGPCIFSFAQTCSQSTPGHVPWPASTAPRQRAPWRPSWARWKINCHRTCRVTRGLKCMWHHSSDCLSPGSFSSTPVRTSTSNVLWWNASSGLCRAWSITTWWPTGGNISCMCCWPCCTPTMPPITVPLTWCSRQSIGPIQSGLGSACTCLDARGTWQASELPSLCPGTGKGWAKPGVSSPRAAQATGWRRSSTWRSCSWRHYPVTYNVSNAVSEPIKGSIYGPKLQKVMLSDCFDLEAILDMCRHGNRTQYLAKWVSYSASFNSWEGDIIATVAFGPHGNPRWSLQHLPPTPWSSHCLETRALSIH